MAIFRCDECKHIQEVAQKHIGKNAKCPKCKEPIYIMDTIEFINSLLEDYTKQTQELESIKDKTIEEYEDETIEYEPIENEEILEVDLYNTKELTEIANYQPIIDWFKNSNIKLRFEKDCVDTTGFFDEIALIIGSNYYTLAPIIKHIKYIQTKGYDTVKIDLSFKTDEEIIDIKYFCKEMYDCSFIAKYFHHKKNKFILLTLQNIPKIKNFFNGIWMEWFVLMQMLEFFEENEIGYSSMKSLKVTFPNKETNELDVFFLLDDDTPIYIECKTGEFRHDINKYLQLKKKLYIHKDNFIVCVFGLSEDQTIGMTTMYDITFVNESNLIEHIEKILY